MCGKSRGMSYNHVTLTMFRIFGARLMRMFKPNPIILANRSLPLANQLASNAFHIINLAVNLNKTAPTT